MNTIEERVHAATRAAADTVLADDVPPLRLPSAYPARSRRDFRPTASAWARRLAPVAAALAVVAVAVAMVTVSRAMHHSPATGGATSAPGAMTAGPAASSYVASGLVPPYYVSIESRGNPNFHPSYAVVRATATGAVLGEVLMPAGRTVVAVTAAADDRTFALDLQPWVPPGSHANQSFEPRAFELLRLGSGGGIESLSPMAASVPRGEMMTGFALSPDGSKLAIAVQPDNVKSEPDLQEIRVYTLATGAVRMWSANGTIGFGPDDARSLSWADDERTLAFDWIPDGPGIHTGVWLLNLDTSGGNLLADSRQAVSLGNASLLFPTISQPALASGSAAASGAAATSASGSVPPSVSGSLPASASGSVPASASGSVPGSASGSVSASASGSAPASASGSAPASVSDSVSASAPGSVPASASPAAGANAAPANVLPDLASEQPLACQEDSIITPDGSLIVCGALKILKTTLNGSGSSAFTSDIETGFLEYSTATGKVTRVLGNWRFDHVSALTVDLLWSNSTGSVLIGVIPSANGAGRVGIISGNEFTPLPTQASSVPTDSGTW